MNETTTIEQAAGPETGAPVLGGGAEVHEEVLSGPGYERGPGAPAAAAFPRDSESGDSLNPQAGKPALLPKLLMPGEAAELCVCEEIIERTKMSFIECGTALTVIISKRLWRESYASREDYLARRWGFSARRAQQLMDASEMVRALGLSRKGGHSGSEFALPASEKHVRALKPLPEEYRREAWCEAVTSAPARGLTTAHIQKVVGKWLGRLGLGSERSEVGSQKAGPGDSSSHLTPALSPSGEGGVSRREGRLREAAERAISETRDLMALAGTADSQKAAGVRLALDHLQDYRDHLESMEARQAHRG